MNFKKLNNIEAFTFKIIIYLAKKHMRVSKRWKCT